MQFSYPEMFFQDSYSEIENIFTNDESSECGYCKKKSGYINSYMIGRNVVPIDYQLLLDRGLSRSGTMLYKPYMPSSCCCQYTIKCDVENFNFSKSHRKVLRKFINHLQSKTENTEDQPTRPKKKGKQNQAPIFEDMMNEIISLGPDVFKIVTRSLPLHLNAATGLAYNRAIDDFWDNKGNHQELMKNKNIDPFQYLEDILNKAKKSVSTGCEGMIDMYVKFHDAVHNRDRHEDPEKSFYTFLGSSPMEYVPFISKDVFNHKFPRDYCCVDSPPLPMHMDSECLDIYKSSDVTVDYFDYKFTQYGTYVQQYFVFGKLFAIGVIDILPSCLSSVYAMYYPEYISLGPGKLVALFEIYLSRLLSKNLAHFKNYYLGYYIENCQKMRYKSAYEPCYLLCPKNYEWVEFKFAQKNFDLTKYNQLSFSKTKSNNKVKSDNNSSYKVESNNGDCRGIETVPDDQDSITITADMDPQVMTDKPSTRDITDTDSQDTSDNLEAPKYLTILYQHYPIFTRDITDIPELVQLYDIIGPTLSRRFRLNIK